MPPSIIVDLLKLKKSLIKELEQKKINEIFAEDSLLNLLELQFKRKTFVVSKRVKRRLRGKIQERKQKILNSRVVLNPDQISILSNYRSSVINAQQNAASNVASQLISLNQRTTTSVSAIGRAMNSISQYIR